MSFSTDQITGPAQEIEAEFAFKLDHEREQRVLAVVKDAVENLSKELGGYLAVSATGHINDFEGGVGDNINIQLSSLLPPSKPAQDAGLEAAAGSARNFPPEASTAAPATEDNSPPATQEPIPQSADAVPPTVEEPVAATDPTPTSSESSISGEVMSQGEPLPVIDLGVRDDLVDPNAPAVEPVPPVQDQNESPSSPDTSVTDIAA